MEFLNSVIGAAFYFLLKGRMFMKKLFSVLVAATMLLGIFGVTASAEAYSWGGWDRPGNGGNGSKNVRASFFLLNEGLEVPVGTASQPSKNYKLVGSGVISVSNNMSGGIYDETGVNVKKIIVSEPDVPLEEGQSVIWYVAKLEDDGWHIDGVVTPFCSVLYDANCDNAAGAVTDGTHYYKGDSATVKENGFTREGYDFIGWNTAADGTGTAYKPGDVITSDKLNFSANMNTVTLYACWKKQPATDKPDTDREPGKNEVKGSIVCPKRMSVRFEDGTVYYGGESIILEIGKEYKFQMCSNNWDNDRYSDDGDGICGTVVYTVKVSNRYDERSFDPETKTFVLPKGDPVLRTDVNKCFMAYRYHFKTDYNKQTGIKQVVNTPLESLSVNLPLGSTIKSDAYIAYKYVGSADVFIENNEDLTISYTDYMWNY